MNKKSLTPLNRSDIALAILALALIWSGTRPYLGISHDARFYAVQALARLHPEAFAKDLYFLHGSQDQFSAFSYLYTPVIEAFGLGMAHALGFGIGHACWLVAAWLLAAALIPDFRVRLWSIAALLVLPSQVGVLDTIAYAEPSVTPRLFAEAASIFAIAAVLNGRVLLSLVAVGGGIAIHPLMAVPIVWTLVLLLLIQHGIRMFTLALAGALIGIGLLFPLIDHLDFARMDALWLDVTQKRS